MSSLRYVGPTRGANHVGTKEIIDAAALEGLTEAQVTARLDSLFSPIATTEYVDQQDALRASTASVDAGDNQRVRLAARAAANGVATLDSSGMIPTTQMPSELTAINPGWMFSAGSYASGAGLQVTGTTQMRLLATMSVAWAAPQIQFYLSCWGSWECRGISGSGRPYIEVRQGGTTGQIVARGLGSSRGQYHSCVILPISLTPISSSNGLTFYVYGRNTSSGTIEFTGSGGAATPNLVGLTTPAGGVVL